MIGSQPTFEFRDSNFEVPANEPQSLEEKYSRDDGRTIPLPPIGTSGKTGCKRQCSHAHLKKYFRRIFLDFMLVGPVFTREFVTAPRRVRFYAAPAIYVGALLLLTCTAWLLLIGAQEVRSAGNMARFGSALFQFLAPLQLVLVVFFSALATASAVAQEKDRRTLVLLLLTNLSNSELVLGKLLASLLSVLIVLFAGLPFFMLIALFGGVSFEQILRVFVVTLVSALAAGSLGSTIALWREKTFQILALTTLAIGVLGAWEVLLASGTLFGNSHNSEFMRWAAGLSPWQAMMAAAKPRASVMLPHIGSAFNLYLCVAGAFTVIVNVLAVALVRVWNPNREARPRVEEPEDFRGGEPVTPAIAGTSATPARSIHAAPGKIRSVWDNPILWREVCTWAYGRKVLAIRLVYVALFVASVLSVYRQTHSDVYLGGGNIPLIVLPLFLLSLVLVNALSVTSITTERDLGALDLLLVTDVSPSEFIFGKLFGVFYVAKEIIILPLVLCVYLRWAGALSLEHLIYLIGGLLVMNVFVATLGVHVGLSYHSSRSAVAVSLGTVFFLFVGIAAVMRIMVSFRAVEFQLAPFLALILGGGVGLYVALGLRNPSQAIALASFLLPVITFVAITGFLQGESLGVFLEVVFTYGLTTAAMLVPAIAEFDIATGRTTE
jgi:ABC-type transport system involved in multi-copper enzyme maturation permease subunit